MTDLNDKLKEVEIKTQPTDSNQEESLQPAQTNMETSASSMTTTVKDVPDQTDFSTATDPDSSANQAKERLEALFGDALKPGHSEQSDPFEQNSSDDTLQITDDIADMTIEEVLEKELNPALKAKIIEQANKFLDSQAKQALPEQPSNSTKAQNSADNQDEQSIYPEELYLLPIKERPFFPGQQLPVLINRKTWESTFEKAETTHPKFIGFVFVDREDHENAEIADFSAVGTLIKVSSVKRRDDYIQLMAEGVCRFKIDTWLSHQAPYFAKVHYLNDLVTGTEDQLKAYALALLNAFRELLPLNPLYSDELKYFLGRYNNNDPAQLADFAAGLTTADNDKLQDILETEDLIERMEKVLAIFKHEIEVTKLQFTIRERVEDNLSDHQREFFLRQQLTEIQKELGIVKDDKTLDKDRFEERIEKLALSDEALQKAEEELNKLAVLDPQSPEYNVARNWLDWLTQLPWGQISEDQLDLKAAKKILDKKHDGLEDVKDRILEFLAVGALKGEVAGSIICLVGPPGVGKTSIGKSIAESLGRKFYRFSVGGMRDEAEIKGHRRTYIGAMPGKFIQALKDCQTSNPVIMLDEIDKIGSSYNGDPASALLEVLDPEQNNDFMDHFMDVRFDLSKAVFVCTANTLDSIPGPLLDRMEVIRLSGYITEEKVQIAKNHLWPNLLQDAGLTAKQLQITTQAIRQIIEGYAREAGVRNLKKLLAKVIRKMAMRFVQNDLSKVKIHLRELEELLGKPSFTAEKMNQEIGTVTGLAWTSMGGATLSIEASRVHTHNRGFKLSGQLGEVMQESAGIAFSYISSNLEKYQADHEFFDKAFVHLHVPDGATPKDGPSAGITMATALLSLARGESLKKPIAMTGELSLTGHVLPVGGIREKVIAARRLGIQHLILPKDNQKDYLELPDYLQAGLDVKFAEHFSDVAKQTFHISKKSVALKGYLEKSANS